MYTSSIYSGGPSLTVFHSKHKQKNECSTKWHADGCEFFWNCPLPTGSMSIYIALAAMIPPTCAPITDDHAPLFDVLLFKLLFLLYWESADGALLPCREAYLALYPGFLPQHLSLAGCWVDVWSSGTFHRCSCEAAFWTQEMSPRLPDVDHSAVPWSVVVISSALTSGLLCHFSTCPPNVQVWHCTWQV